MTRVQKLASVSKSRGSTVAAAAAAVKKKASFSTSTSASSGGSSGNSSGGGSSSKSNIKKCGAAQSAFTRLGYHVSSNDAREGVGRRVEAALAKGAKVGVQLLVGFKAINRFFKEHFQSVGKSTNANANANANASAPQGEVGEEGNGEEKRPSVEKKAKGEKKARPGAGGPVLCVCKDSPPALLAKILEAASLHTPKLPVAVVPGFAVPLANALQLHRASCFLLPAVPAADAAGTSSADSAGSAANTGAMSSSDVTTAALDELRCYLHSISESH